VITTIENRWLCPIARLSLTRSFSQHAGCISGFDDRMGANYGEDTDRIA
jgi:hypothetical protein